MSMTTRVLGVFIVLAISMFHRPEAAAQQQPRVYHIGFLSSGVRSGGTFSVMNFIRLSVTPDTSKTRTSLSRSDMPKETLVGFRAS